MEVNQTKDQIINFIKEKVGNRPAILGLSGGLDSSVIAYLAVEALGADKVHGFILPSSTNTDSEVSRAKQVVQIFNLQSSIFSIDPIVESFQQNTDLFKTRATTGNLKARIRMSILYG